MNRKKKAYHSFDNDSLNRASEAVKNGTMSYREAENKFKIPKSTIQRRVKKIQQNRYGRPPVFNEVEETQLSECLALSAEWGFPLTAIDVKYIVKKFLDRKGVEEKRFKNNMPGKNWLKGFLKRQRANLKTSMAHNIKRARAAVTPEIIEAYFEELSVALKDVPKEAIINYDETAMQDNPGQSKVIVRRKCKHPDRIMDHSKSNFSVMFAGTASGKCLPPFVVYKADHVYHTWMEGGPAGARYSKSKSGWFEGNIFEEWFATIALPYLKKLGDGRKAIIGDNLASHISVNILEECVKNNIHFLLLPPNSTHLCQPLDLAFFSPLKTVWRKMLTEWKTNHRGSVTKDNFPRLLKKTLDELEDRTAENVKAGFEKSGIHPLNKNKVLEILPKVSQPDEESGSRWTQSFEEFLKSKREQETVVKARKKRMDVLPGKSLTEANIIEQLKAKETEKAEKQKKKSMPKKVAVGANVSKSDSENIRPKKRKVTRPRSIDDSDSEDNCAMSLHDSSSDGNLDNMLNEILFDDDFDQNIDFEVVNLQEEEYMNDNEDANEVNHLEIEDEAGIGIEIETQKNNNENKDTYEKHFDDNEDANEINRLEIEDEAGIDIETETEKGNNEYNETNEKIIEFGNEEEKTSLEHEKYTENEFVLVQYTYDEGTKKQAHKRFVGKILLVTANFIRISFMRNFRGSNNVYVFPDIQDTDDVAITQIQRPLDLLSQFRGRYTFDI